MFGCLSWGFVCWWVWCKLTLVLGVLLFVVWVLVGWGGCVLGGLVSGWVGFGWFGEIGLVFELVWFGVLGNFVGLGLVFEGLSCVFVC